MSYANTIEEFKSLPEGFTVTIIYDDILVFSESEKPYFALEFFKCVVSPSSCTFKGSYELMVFSYGDRKPEIKETHTKPVRRNNSYYALDLKYHQPSSTMIRKHQYEFEMRMNFDRKEYTPKIILRQGNDDRDVEETILFHILPFPDHDVREYKRI